MKTTSNRFPRPVLLALAAGAAMALPGAALGQMNYTWGAGVNGSWNDGTKWLPMGVPTGVDNASLSVAGAYTVNIPNGTGQGVANLTVGNSNATLFLPDNCTLQLNGSTQSNAGTIQISGPGQPGNNTRLLIAAPTTFSGSGVIALRAPNNGDNNAAYIDYTAAPNTLTNTATHTINGNGRVYPGLINAGLVDANQSGKLIRLLDQPKSNSGVMQASSGGTLIVNCALSQSAGGVLRALDTSAAVLQSASVSGGMFTTAGSGVIVNTNGQGSTVDGVTITNGSLFQLNDNSTVSLGGGGLVNNGLVTIQNIGGAGNNTRILATAPTTISGAGAVTLQGTGNGDNNSAYIDYSAAASTVTIGSAQTMNGRGIVYAGLINNGTLDANVSGKRLVLTDQPKTNTGTMRATAGGELWLRGTTVSQSGAGQLRADNATVVFHSSTLNGGPMSAVNGGLLLNNNGQASAINAVTLTQGTFQLNDNSAVAVSGGFVNNGLVTIQNIGGAGNNTHLVANAPSQTFSGTGTIRLQATSNFSNSAYIDYNSFGSPAVPGVITNAAAHTIAGNGRLSVGFTNNGTILADNGTANQQVLNLFDQPKTNNSLMRATGGGQLWITNTAVTQASNATIQVDANSVCGLISSSITGGRLTSSGTGFILNNNGQGSVIDGVTLTAGSLLQMNDNSVLQVNNSLTNNGLLTIQTIGGPGNNTHLDAGTPNVPLSGSGTIRLQSTSNFSNSAYLGYTTATNVFTNAAGHTVAGNGRIFTNLVNNGTILADESTNNRQVLEFLDQPKTNNALIRATGGGQLRLTSVAVTQAPSGSFQADPGSACVLFNSSVTGGVLTSSGTGLFVNTNGQGSTIDGVTLAAGSLLQVNDNSTLSLGAGGLTNNGLVTIQNIGGAGNNTRLFAPGAATVGGNGALRLQATGFGTNSAYVEAGGDAMHPLTIGSGQTLTGTGRLYGNINFQGAISPDQPFGTPGTIGQIGAFSGTLAMAPTTVFNAEIGAANSADTIVGNAAITVAGTLNVTFVNGYTPAGNDVITLISGSSISGRFSTIHIPPVGTFGPAHVEYLPNAVVLVMCYVNCDGSTSSPTLNVNDFTCFLNRFAAGDAYSNCDGSTTMPVLNVNDFACFLNRFAAGCQ